MAQITIAPAQGLTPGAIERYVRDLAQQGYHAVITSALDHDEQRPFTEAGFTVHERLHLLRHDLGTLPVPPPGWSGRVRRGRRADRPTVLAVDGAAFNPFWRFDERGLEEARSATPTSRFRVAVDRAVVGYAVTGRAGHHGYLQRLAVLPGHQRQGIGTALVNDSLRWARSHGARSVLVNTQESNDTALQLYLHLGFELEAHGLAVLERPLHDVGTGS